MKSKLLKARLWLVKHQLQTGIAFILLGTLLQSAGWDRITLSGTVEINADLMCISIGTICAIRGFLQKMKQ